MYTCAVQKSRFPSFMVSDGNVIAVKSGKLWRVVGFWIARRYSLDFDASMLFGFDILIWF